MPEFLTIFSGEVNSDYTAVDTYNLREMGIVPEELPVLTNIALTIGYTILFVFLAWLILKRRDL